MLALIRCYTGGNWYGDWFEHYQRTEFFLERWPEDFMFIGTYSLSARPPFFNVLCSHFLAQLNASYALYQVTCVLLGLSVFFPVFLFAKHWGRGSYSIIAIVALFLCLNPALMQKK